MPRYGNTHPIWVRSVDIKEGTVTIDYVLAGDAMDFISGAELLS